MKIGIPRSLYFYYYGDLWLRFFDNLNIETKVTPPTNQEILDLGNKLAQDEMCLSMKIYLGHIAYLKDCDYILIPRIDNFGSNNQTCTNFLATYDIASNIFPNKILNYNIDLEKKQSEYKGFLKLKKDLNKSKKEIKKAYLKAKEQVAITKKQKIKENIKKLNKDGLKILLVSHPYNSYDEMIGKPIIESLEKLNVQVIYSDLFDEEKARIESKKLSKELYFKYNKENIGSIMLSLKKIDGVIFLSSFPCGPDSLVNELVIRKLNLPTLNLIVDDLSSDSGIQTRIESFVDILEAKNE